MKLLFSCLFPVLFVCFLSFGQERTGKAYFLVDSVDHSVLSENDRVLLDSILPIYHKTQNDTVRLNLLNVIIENCLDEQIWPKYNELMYAFADKKLKSGKKLSKEETLFLKIRIGDALNNRGFIHINKGEVNEAIEAFNEALKIQEQINYKKGLASSLGNLAYVYKQKGDINKALELYHKSLKYNEETGNEEGVANSYNNIGLIYKNQGDIDKAQEYYLLSLEMWKKIGKTQGMAACLSNLGYIYSSKGDKKRALHYYEQALKLDEENSDKWGMATSLNNIGLIYMSQGKNDEAKEYFEKSLQISEDVGNKKALSESLSNLAVIYLGKNDMPKALGYGERAFATAKELGYPNVISNAAEILADIYGKQNKWREAFEMKELQRQMKDSILSEETQKTVLKQQIKYQYDKQEALNEAEHKKEIALAAEAKKRQEIITWSVIGGLILILIFSIFMFKRYRVTQRQKEVIELQKGQVTLAYDQLSEKNKEMIDSIKYAKRIQEALLKEQEHVSKHLPEHFILFKPKDIVSGDFYWSYERDGWWYMAAADCTGHGVPGAFLTMLGTAFLNEIMSSSKTLPVPAEVLNQLRDKIVKELSQAGKEEDSLSQRLVKDGMDISLMRYNLQTKELQWSGANNPLWIVRKGNDNADGFSTFKESFGLKEISADKQPIGHYTNSKPFTHHYINLQKNDTIYLFTDGFADQFGGPQGKKLKYKPLLEKLMQVYDEPLPSQKKILSDYFYQWRGDLDQVDDVTLIGIKV